MVKSNYYTAKTKRLKLGWWKWEKACNITWYKKASLNCICYLDDAAYWTDRQVTPVALCTVQGKYNIIGIKTSPQVWLATKSRTQLFLIECPALIYCLLLDRLNTNIPKQKFPPLIFLFVHVSRSESIKKSSYPNKVTNRVKLLILVCKVFI